MNRKDLIRRLKLPEWDDLEAKEAKSALPKDIWKTVSAFCNTNGGVIVLGVRDQGKGRLEIIGVENPDKVQADFITGLRSGKFNIQLSSRGHLFTIEGKKVIAFRLPPMPRQAKPVYYSGDIRNTFIRQGATDQKASKDEIGRLLREASEYSSDSTLITGTGMKDIDGKTVRDYQRYLEVQNREHPFITLTDEELLEKCGCMKEGVLTMAGLLLFGKTDAIINRFPAYGLSVFRMSSLDKQGLEDRRWDDRKIYEDNLINSYFAVMDHLKRYVPVPFKMSKDSITRTENVPHVIAVREALVNLLVHRDYFDNGQASIRIHDDRIVFKNPGAVPFPIEHILNGCESVPRNPTISRVFRLPGWAEIAGSGMMKIFNNWKEAGYKPPVLKNNDPVHWFTIEFYESEAAKEENIEVKGSTTQETTQETAQETTQENIIRLIELNPYVTRKELAAKTGFSDSGVKYHLKKLTEEGRIRHIGPTKKGKWEVLK